MDLESILPNFNFFIFPIFAIKLGHFKAIFFMLQTLKLNSKNGKKSSFYKGKSLVGLTPVNPIKLCFFLHFTFFAVKLSHFVT
jgi:hypothetical protein